MIPSTFWKICGTISFHYIRLEEPTELSREDVFTNPNYGDNNTVTHFHDNVVVSGNASIYGDTRFHGHVRISGNTKIYGNAVFHDKVEISGNASIIQGVKNTKEWLVRNLEFHLNRTQPGDGEILSYLEKLEDSMVMLRSTSLAVAVTDWLLVCLPFFFTYYDHLPCP